MGKYIDGSGLSHFMGILKGAFATKGNAVSNITRSGTTFTATRADGTSFTFTQQDNTVAKTTTTPKMDGTAAIGTETKYAAGDHVHPTDTSRVPTSRTVCGKALSSDVTLTASDVGISVFEGATSSANGTVGLVPQPLSANMDNQNVLFGDGNWDGLHLEFLTSEDYPNTIKVTVDKGYDDAVLPQATTTYAGLMSTDHVTKLNGIAAGAQVNQNAFSNVKVGSTTVAADTKTDTLELVGSNVTLTPDATNDKVTIGITASNVTTALGNTAVARATGDASGNAIASTYAKLASPALTGTPTAPTAAAGTSTTQIATTAFVSNAVGTATAGALQYKGTVAAESTITGAAYKKGWYYVVSTAGTYVGKVCEVGDMLIAKQDKTSTPANDWDAIQSNIEVLSNSEIDALWAAA